MRDFMIKNRGKLICLLDSGVLILLFHIFKKNTYIMIFVADHLTSPLKNTLGRLSAPLPFSLAELLVIIYILLLLALLLVFIIKLVTKEQKLSRALSFGLGIICHASVIYAAFSLLWGVNYYTPTFKELAGIEAAPSSVEELYKITEYFAGKLSEASAKVPRDENLLFNPTIEECFERSLVIYDNIEEKYPFLKLQDVAPKPVYFSKLMSRAFFTGFYFPFTGEANINVDAPLSMLPATIIHEFAHRRHIASEDEANFMAILACAESDDEVFKYSSYFFAYVYLANSLLDEDADAWLELRSSLPPEVIADLDYNFEYWDAFDSPINEISTEIYDSFLKNYGQASGVKSYGEVVDLLISYYKDKI